MRKYIMTVPLILCEWQRPCFLAFLARERGFSHRAVLFLWHCMSVAERKKKRGKMAYFLTIWTSQGPLGQKSRIPFKGFLVISTIKIVTQATLWSKPGDRGKRNQKTHDHTHYISGFDFSVQLFILPAYGILISFGHLYIVGLGTLWMIWIMCIYLRNINP